MRHSTIKRAIAVALLLMLSSAAALADFGCGDVVIKSAKAYSDKAMTQYVGTIPAYTALLAEYYNENWQVSYDTGVVRVMYNGSASYIAASKLWNDNYDAKYSMTLPRKTKIYQRPSKSSAKIKLKKKQKNIQMCKRIGNWLLVRTNAVDHNGRYGYVYWPDFKNVKELEIREQTWN